MAYASTTRVAEIRTRRKSIVMKSSVVQGYGIEENRTEKQYWSVESRFFRLFWEKNNLSYNLRHPVSDLLLGNSGEIPYYWLVKKLRGKISSQKFWHFCCYL